MLDIANIYEISNANTNLEVVLFILEVGLCIKITMRVFREEILLASALYEPPVSYNTRTGFDLRRIVEDQV